MNQPTANYSTFRDRNDGLMKRLAHAGIHSLDRLFGHFSLVGDHPFFNPDRFPWTRDLEANWPVMRDELDAILEYRDALPSFHDVTEDASTISHDDQWKTYFFYGYGEKVEANCARCPETTRLIEQVPGMQTAFFSILSPGKHIPAHRGPYKGVLRYHLGLKVPHPAERCRIRVADAVQHWEEGQSMVFDDTFNHEVWNETDGERAILFMDIKRPLPAPLDWFNTLILRVLRRSSVVQDARKNQEKWNERLDRAMQEA